MRSPNSSVGLHPDAHFCVHKIYKIINNGVLWKIKHIYSPQSPLFARNFRWETLRWDILGVRLFAAIHLFISSHNEIEDFCSMDKKIGQRYGRRSKFVSWYYLYTCVYLYLMRRNVMRRYRQRNHIQQDNIYSNLFSHYNIFFVWNFFPANTVICDDNLMRNG